MMEDVERRRGRGLPVDALEGRLELLRRRGVLTLGADAVTELLGLIAELNRAHADRGEIEATLVGWFTRSEKRSGTALSDATVRAEGFVDYLLDVSGAGELHAFERLRGVLDSPKPGQ